MNAVTRAEVAVTACSDLFRGQADILASPAGVVPTIGVRLALLTHAPDLMISDGESTILGDVPAVDRPSTTPAGYLPYRELFELITTGRRHVVMGGAQIDRFGNQNLSAIGEHARPTRQLLGTRAAATNTVNHATSYWIPRHSRRNFVENVDYVTGIGTDRARAAGTAARFHRLHQVVTNLGVLDFSGPDSSMALVSLHPGVTLEEIQAATGFPLHSAGPVSTTRLPDERELHLIREVLDPRNRREQEVPS
ncbi:CoA-transferase [Arthrobacter sp. zg-Y820]|uniref:CoA-transferase subunit beta n=1 Tax=unclassified Arthrobacter TaxID=235627 RepID=UPI002540CE9E|nr:MULTISPECIES: CoA-transferase [unclassified Arthrobacter]MCC9196787.1 CoA-transferase [Arthrobacter sp. zg-Y820]MDK1279649.1 CoA-transferase [Arthrobacter sp. zg.Y820]MDK1358730.1 CoA-transferase [Arthrobacter sp. zg-Y1219]WIB07981.1 CoA-transferase [Arthrobacter sp. zg-Y820]